MKKQLLASLLSVLFIVGLASANADTACCKKASSCTTAMECVNGKLTKEECMRFCEAKAAAIKANPALAKAENKGALCRAIVKADPTMKPIIMKMKKNCCHSNKQCSNDSSSSMSGSQESASTSQAASSASQSTASAAQGSSSSARQSASAAQNSSSTSQVGEEVSQNNVSSSQSSSSH